MMQRTLLCALTISLVAVTAACTPCPQVHCDAEGTSTSATEQREAGPVPVLVVSTTLGGISRLAARWQMKQRRQRGVRKGTRVLLEDGEKSLLAVTALPSPLRVDAEPGCSECVLLQGTMPLKIELGRADGPRSSLEEHPTGLLSHWSLQAKLKASRTAGGIELRVMAAASIRPSVELRWEKNKALSYPLDQAALALAREAVTAEVMRTASELVVLYLTDGPGTQEAFGDEDLQVQIQAPLLRLILSAPSGKGLDPMAIHPGVGQDVAIGVSPSLLAKHGYQSPSDTDFGYSQLLSLTDARRALEYRVRVSEGSSFYELAGITVPGRRGAEPVFDLLRAPRLLEAGGKAGHSPPAPERRAEAVGAALKPLRTFLKGLLVKGPGDVRAGLMIARYESGAMLLESAFTDPRARPSGPPPAHRAVQSPNPRHPAPRLRAVGPRAPEQKAPAPPWAHPPPQSATPSTR